MKKTISRIAFIFKSIHSFSSIYIFMTVGLKAFTLINIYIMLYINKIILNYLSNIITTKTCDTISILLLLLICGILEIVSTLIFNILQYQLGRIKLKYDDKISLELATSFSNLDMSYYDDTESYNQTLQAGKCKTAIIEGYNIRINLIFDSLSFFIALFVVIRFSIFVAMLSIISIIPGMMIKRKIQTYQYDEEKRLIPGQRLSDYLLSLFYSREVEMEMQVYGFQNHIKKLVDDNQTIIRKERLKSSLKNAKNEATLSLIDKSFYILQQLIMVQTIVNRELSIGDYSYYGGIICNLQSSLNNIINSINGIHLSDIKLDEYIKIVSRKPRIYTLGQLDINNDEPNMIEFVQVSFKYKNTTKNALSKVCFKIKIGEKIAFVGPNGSGKTTIIKLLLRLYDPTEGSILLNGINIKEYDLNQYRSLFSPMFQEPIMYLMTIKENIAIADIHNQTVEVDNKVNKLLSSLGLWGTNKEVLDANMYYGREFHPYGIILSAGQKQRIQAARTLYRDCSFYVLDEPASSMDSISENVFLNTLLSYTESKAIIYITHRYNNLNLMNNIIVLNNGKIVETGKHSELIAKKGMYNQMFKMQKDKTTSI